MTILPEPVQVMCRIEMIHHYLFYLVTGSSFLMTLILQYPFLRDPEKTIKNPNSTVAVLAGPMEMQQVRAHICCF
jgi:hypothetical protein